MCSKSSDCLNSTDCSKPSDALSNIQKYYGTTIKSRADLVTTACLVDDSQSTGLVRKARKNVHQEVQDRFYGCGSPIPPVVEGLTVLDLGCGTGRDCYILSQLVGPKGRIIGVDMSADQIEVANRHADWHAERFGFKNFEYKNGQMEDLAKLGIKDSSIDLVVSNCVLNLSLDKAQVVREIFRVLKPGGELYFSDIFTDRRLPSDLMQDPTLHGECLAGAWYKEDLRRLLASSGCADLRITTSRPIEISNQEVAEKIGFAAFTSCTIRAFKLDTLEDRSEDYGQVIMYKGNLSGHPHTFQLDAEHEFPQGKRVPVSGNTADILTATRFAPYFELVGDKSIHFGLFQPSTLPAVTSATSVAETSQPSKGGCC
ncbi:Protein-L-isoaspartate O-methyltransferase [Elsinoe australis]|uniref:Arsenite methyltransferase n=1 Tax=Elsinoe australis TaxID=40998 RepID=A0A2P8AJR9_9PEZI|nr:Protein-L-isoaspartate O-methyltransferase [Elsinoe australis]